GAVPLRPLGWRPVRRRGRDRVGPGRRRLRHPRLPMTIHRALLLAGLAVAGCRGAKSVRTPCAGDADCATHAVTPDKVRREVEALVLAVGNISLGGVYLVADNDDRFGFQPSSVYELTLFDARDDTVVPVRARARVIRYDDTGVGFTWEHADGDGAPKLRELLD